jgi:hypothetical protein
MVNLVISFVDIVVIPASVFLIFKSELEDYIIVPVVFAVCVSVIPEVALLLSFKCNIVSGVFVFTPSLLFVVL